jgi:hypothetical protein
LQRRPVAFVESERERPALEPLPAQPTVMGERPGAGVVDEAVPQQQLREPMPDAHQVSARVLARPHQITGRLLVRLRDTHRHQLAQPQQPGQPLRVATVSLDLSPDARGIFDGATTVQAIPAPAHARASPYPVGAAS